MARKRKFQRMRRHRARSTVILVLLLIFIAGGGAAVLYFHLSGADRGLPMAFEAGGQFPGKVAELSDKQVWASFAQDLCVSAEGSVPMDGISQEPSQYGGLFDLENKTVRYGQNIYEQIYPASLTKIMTAILALKNGNLKDTVTISQEALDLEEGSQVCGFQAGDKIELDGLIRCLLVYSGNDAAAAIAEHVGGTEENFVQMMNEEAVRLGMTGTHFTNPHGLQDTQHYTCIYDIYLMLNEAIKYPEFMEMIQLDAYTAEFQDASGNNSTLSLGSTDYYLIGEATPPKDVTVLGGKTGTTDEAGNCLALVSQNAYGNTFISIVTNAVTKEVLYEQMNQLLGHINS